MAGHFFWPLRQFLSEILSETVLSGLEARPQRQRIQRLRVDRPGNLQPPVRLVLLQSSNRRRAHCPIDLAGVVILQQQGGLNPHDEDAQGVARTRALSRGADRRLHLDAGHRVQRCGRGFGRGDGR